MASPQPAPVDSSRVSALDGLRGIGALAVVVFHYLDRGPSLHPEIGERFTAFQFGSYGVDLFFIISGFVIFMSLRRSTLRRFTLSRLIRLYPVYWLCVGITFAVIAVFGLGGREVSPLAALVNLTMLQSYVGVPHVDGAYWTLAVEIAFYAQCGLLLALGLIKQRSLDWVLPLWLAISAAVLIASSVLSSPILSVLRQAFGWSPLFIIGIALYCFWTGDRRFRLIALVPLSVAVIVLRDPVEAIATVVLIALTAFALWGPQFGLTSRPLRWLGGISYALYLLHQNIGYVALIALSPLIGQAAATAIVMVGMLLLASAVTYLFDNPVRRYLRAKLLPARDPAEINEQKADGVGVVGARPRLSDSERA